MPAMTDAKLRSIHKRLERAKKILAKERDDLRTIIDELEDYEHIASDAYDAIEQAADRISEYL
jgi:ATP-dependent Zn protease